MFERLSLFFQLNIASTNQSVKVVDPLEAFRLRSKLMNHLESYRLTLSEEERRELDGK